MDYTKFNVEDFASNESFIDWVRQTDPEAIKFWDIYIANHPEIRPTVEKARALVLNLKLAEEITPDAARIDTMWDKIQDRVERQPQKPSRPYAQRRRAVALVCLVLLGCGVALWFMFPEKPLEGQRSAYDRQSEDFIEQVNETDKPLSVRLADGSTVLLEAKSRLKYKATYLEDSTRQVYLLGKAFFDVVKNPYKPFIVHSSEIIVKVLGTSFRVEAPEDAAQILVSVKTGKVSVSAVADAVTGSRQKEGVILLPNQQASYERKERLFSKTLVDAPQVLDTTAIKRADFVFDNTPIAEVFRRMESAYGIEIIFNDEVMKNCYITAPLGVESMREKLKIICETIDASYEIIDAQVVINSAGCP
jgi:ferric-dicitrate binding protein FerR (iron transport regulator)